MPSITINQILQHYGRNTKCFIIYNDPFGGYGPAPFATRQAALQYYASQGFGIYACIDGSNPPSYYAQLYADCKAAGILMTAPLYLWGYETFWLFNSVATYPNAQEYQLVGMSTPGGTTVTGKPPFYAPFSLIPALAFKTYPGLTVDAPENLILWKKFYDQLHSLIGLQNLIGISGASASDHPVNYNGAQGSMGGNNMNCYVRYVNSVWGLYRKDVNASGNHVSDGTACPLFSLVGGTANYTGSAIIPPLPLALDIYNYHHYTNKPGGTITGINSTFAIYGGASNALLEENIFKYFQTFNPISFWRTPIPTGILDTYIPDWTNFVTVQMGSSANQALAFMQKYPGQIQMPYFNYSNCDDNSSNHTTVDIPCPCNPGSVASVGYGIATPQTVLDFFNNQIPFLANYTPFMEADNEPCAMQSQSTATVWGIRGPQYAATPLSGGIVPKATTLSLNVVPV